ncbi:epoxide hydrolase A [Eucalyptus grandis]|uniref:epoxide hydrolase A n=1 Tax=Eucalyptus grandis TaxID=71139 RepID=UPI00192EAB41|nr:epoxide hydrolase A [Eucalyptus grandis]
MASLPFEYEVSHSRVRTNGIWMHVAEKGEGPHLVLLLHGFPQTWYAWRHQMAFLAARGFRAVAPDLRGFGDSDSPLSPAAYTIPHLVGDLVGLLDHFGHRQAFVVGHDWGAVAGWFLSLFRPDLVKGLVALSSPYSPRSPGTRILESYKPLGDGFFITQFQKPGRAERAFARYDYLTVMKKLLLHNKKEILIAPPEMEIIDFLETPATLPSWITEEDLQVYADKFQESGFTGPLNYYRAMDLNWELLGPWDGAKITVPTKFIIGNKENGFEAAGAKDYIQGNIFKNLVPNVEVVILDGHRFIHEERAQQVCDEILNFFHKHSIESQL